MAWNSNSAAETMRGYMIPIGGAEDHNNTAILHRFVELCGAGDAHIAVIPTASRQQSTGSRYERVFSDLGAGEVSIMRFDRYTNHDTHLETLEQVDGVFMTGGDQRRLAKALRNTPIADKLVARYESGLHVAGTSAGAAFMPEHMIAGGESGSTPRPGIVRMARGLGLTDDLIIDQHFRQRDRLGRLLMALTNNPGTIGIGIDEDTAAFVAPDNVLEVVGSGGVTVVDATDLEHDADQAGKDDPIGMVGLRLHVLTGGGTYDLARRRARIRSG